jgi:hypothetical protein
MHGIEKDWIQVTRIYQMLLRSRSLPIYLHPAVRQFRFLKEKAHNV